MTTMTLPIDAATLITMMALPAETVGMAFPEANEAKAVERVAATMADLPALPVVETVPGANKGEAVVAVAADRQKSLHKVSATYMNIIIT